MIFIYLHILCLLGELTLRLTTNLLEDYHQSQFNQCQSNSSYYDRYEKKQKLPHALSEPHALALSTEMQVEINEQTLLLV